MMNKIIAGIGIEINDNYPPYSNTTGLLRWNGVTQQVEIMTNDGNSYVNQWVLFPSNSPATVGLAPAYENAIHWAMIKMNEEEEIKKLLAKHAGLKDLKEKYEIMLALVREEENVKK